MKRLFITRFIFGISLFICRGFCTTWDDAKAEYVKLYNAYSIGQHDAYVDTIPTNDFSQPLDVMLEFEISSLGGYDAVNGALDVIGSLSMNWTDEIRTLANIKFDSTLVREVIVDYRTIWTPVLVLINSADSVERVGDETYKVRLNLASGQASWKPRIIVKASCTPDVSYFPFDQQKCTFTFAPWFYPKSRLRLSVISNAWKMDNYDVNGVWDIESTESSAYISGDYYYASFTITFNREPTYFTINLVLPILCLSLLSGFVFLLPAASGERVGFVITCFLAFVVLLQTTMTYLPQASAPMSLLCYYVIVMMMFSAFLSLVTALLLRVYHKPKGDTVPRWLVHMLEIIKCIKCRRIICRKKQNAVEDSSASNSPNQKQYAEKGRLLENGKLMPKRTTFNSAQLPSFSNRQETKPTSTAKLDDKNVTGSNMSSGGSPAKAERKIINVVPNASPEDTNISKRNDMNTTGKYVAKSDKPNGTVKVPELETVSDTRTDDGMDDIDWDSVGHLLDTFFLLVFIGVQCGFSILFLVPIGTRA